MLLDVEILFKEWPESILLDSETFLKAGFEDETEVFLWAGANHIKTKVIKTEAPENGKLLIPEIIWNRLNLPSLPKLSAILDPENKTIRIGPFLGFLTIRKNKAKNPPFSSQRILLENFSKEAWKIGMIPFVFNCQDVDWVDQKIRGYILVKNHQGFYQWTTDTLPLPNVVYNRILNRSAEGRASVQEAMANLSKIPNLHHFNPKFLEKWETHEILSQYPALAPYLPDTVRVRRLKDIAEVASKHPIVYIKPINGSLGINIVKLKATPKGYIYQYRRRQKNHTGLWEDPQTLWVELSRILGKRQYIVQQGLEFKSYRGRVFDIRLLIQKGKSGKWVVPAIVARVAAENSIFPNIAAGGEAKQIEEVWQEISEEKWEKSDALKQILRIGYHTAKALEEKLGNFAELGLDIGIDVNGHAWLIEVNSKPSRKVFPKNGLGMKKQSIINIVEYSKYLSGFNCLENRNGDRYEPKNFDN